MNCFADPFEDWPATRQHNNQQAEGRELCFIEVDTRPFHSFIHSCSKKLIIITAIVLTLTDLMCCVSNLTQCWFRSFANTGRMSCWEGRNVAGWLSETWGTVTLAEDIDRKGGKELFVPRLLILLRHPHCNWGKLRKTSVSVAEMC